MTHDSPIRARLAGDERMYRPTCSQKHNKYARTASVLSMARSVVPLYGVNTMRSGEGAAAVCIGLRRHTPEDSVHTDRVKRQLRVCGVSLLLRRTDRAELIHLS